MPKQYLVTVSPIEPDQPVRRQVIVADDPAGARREMIVLLSDSGFCRSTPDGFPSVVAVELAPLLKEKAERLSLANITFLHELLRSDRARNAARMRALVDPSFPCLLAFLPTADIRAIVRRGFALAGRGKSGTVMVTG